MMAAGHGSMWTAGRTHRPAVKQMQMQPDQGRTMTSFMQYGSLTRSRPTIRRLAIGALTCSAVMLTAQTAQANHRMADGTLCPHAAGTPVPGESAPAPGPERSASSAPIGSTGAAAPVPAVRPAAKPASKAPAQRAAAQAQAQRPATSGAQAQRPAVATQPVTSTADVAVTSQRQEPVATPSIARQPRAASKPRVAKPAAAGKRVVAPDVATLRRGVPVERPAAYSVVAGPADSGSSAPVATLAALLGLAGIIVAGMAAARRRVARVKCAASSPSIETPLDAVLEAELQEMIAEARATAVSTSAAAEDEPKL